MKNFFTVLIIAVSFLTIYPQDTIHVPGEYATIQLGINAASNGDIVLVEDGTYIENINYLGRAITVASRFLVDGDLNHVNNTIIDGSQPSHPDTGSVALFISGEDTTSVLCGFTITGGTGTIVSEPSAVRVGGGINCIMSGAKIINCNIEYNTVEYLSGIASGGGIAVGPPGNTHWLILENDTVRNNTVLGVTAGGGGITVKGNLKCQNNLITYNVGESTGGIIYGGGLDAGNTINPSHLLIIGNTIKYNKAISPSGTGNDGGAGGGLSIIGMSNETIIKNNIITHNFVQSNAPINGCFGGGVFLRDTKETTIFSENYIAFNSALDNSICHGAGIAIWSLAGDTSKPRLINNIIVNNTNANYGGGIYISGQLGSGNRPLFINNTIVNNSGSLGGSVYSKNSHPIFMNSILWNNGNEIYTNGGEVSIYYSDVEGGWTGTGVNNINVDPFFVDTLYNLADSSKCIGAGIDSIEINGIWYYCPSYDYFENERPDPPELSMPDIGACENQLGIPVPVELTSFTATVNGKAVILNWSTATELNNLGFEIQRSRNADEFSTVGFVDGHGTTTEQHTYSFTDRNLSNGTNFYRLKQLDLDGSYEYSNVIEVEWKKIGTYQLEQNYPNPFNPATTIGFGINEKINVKISVFNSLGEEVSVIINREMEPGYYKAEFNASNLPSGVYCYRIQAGRFTSVKKMILMK